MTDPLAVLQALADDLAKLAARLGADTQTASAYPTEWTIADVFSHIGSGAVISGLRLANGLGERTFDEGDAAPIWDEWNAKTPTEQIRDGITANQELLKALEAVDDAQREGFQYQLGPYRFDFDAYVMLRVNELALHLWDAAVAVDATDTVHSDAVPVIIDELEMIATWSAKPPGVAKEVDVQTRDPQRSFRIKLLPDTVGFETIEGSARPDLVLPAESFIRLVYGRLDAEHTPEFEGDPATLELLRATFPGI